MEQTTDPFKAPKPLTARGFNLSRLVGLDNPSLSEGSSEFKIAELCANDLELEAGINDLHVNMSSLLSETEAIEQKTVIHDEKLNSLGLSLLTKDRKLRLFSVCLFGGCLAIGFFGIDYTLGQVSALRNEFRRSISLTNETLANYSQVIFRHGALPCPDGPWKSAVALIPTSDRELTQPSAPPDQILAGKIGGTLINPDWGGTWVRICVRVD